MAPSAYRTFSASASPKLAQNLPESSPAGQTIIFMQNIYRWFVLHDTSNTTQNLHKKWPDTRHFKDTEDARLEWLEENPTLQKPLPTPVKHAVSALCASNLLKCLEGDYNHRVRLMELISVRFLRPLLVNYVFNVIDKSDAFKYFAKKPLSRKYVEL
ncbi:hypothetical protein HPB51_010891 [Rhipicephalus microplus]|uniref:Uncharacterized protein n=1 Tax=Rhipicephalus microplus TaxID=6941 RepID=A0A9J6DMA8_RHIMP|nr:hypothetical protein HPB51_010891 [Rhipicephalus microplus]